MIVSSDKGTKTKKEEDSKAKSEFEELTAEIETGLDLRPRKLDDYVGQDRVVRQLKLILDSARMRETLPEHILFHGQPGLGKTTLANLIANEMNVAFKVISAPGIQKIGDLVSLLVNIEEDTVLFIDEIHRLRAPLEETLYTAMEDKVVDLVMGKGQGATTMRLDIKNFTLVGATTLVSKISKPLRDRFPTVFNLEPYSDGDILILLERNADLLNLKMNEEAKKLVCNRCRGVPRIANNILKRFVDLQTVHKIREIDYDEAERFLLEIGIFENGLTKSDINYMRALLDGSLALSTLSGVLMEEPETLEQFTEPYLINLGFLGKTSGGRNLTKRGKYFVMRFSEGEGVK